MQIGLVTVLATGWSLAFNTWKQIATVCQLAYAAFNCSVMHKMFH